MQVDQSPKVSFGAFELDLRTRELRKHGLKISLPEQSIQILALLLERRGQVVLREEIQNKLWPHDTVVEFDHSINAAVKRLRRALGDEAVTPRYVETLPRRGYRFIYPLAQVGVSLDAGRDRQPLGETQRPALIARRYSVLALCVLMAAALGGGGWYWFRRSRSMPEAVESIVPLTSYVGAEVSPSFSPDGNQVVFSWNGERQNNFDIYLKQIGSPTPLRLTTDPADDVRPAFSPDGRSIGFIRVSKEHSNFIVIPAIGGPERLVAEIPAPCEFSSHSLAWFPDGKWVVTDGLTLLSAETGDTRTLTSSPIPDCSPSVSPDGRTVAFSRGSALDSQIYLLELSEDLKPKGAPRRLTSLKAGNADPIWTPDGRKIIFSSNTLGTDSSLRLVSAYGGGEPQKLPFSGGEVTGPAISRSGNRLVYERDAYDSNIWRLPLSAPAVAASPPAQFIASTRGDADPQYSPDGKRIAFESDRGGAYGIWVCDADGSNTVELFSRPGVAAGTPRWSPDGQRIAFDGNLERKFDIYAIRATGGKPVRLTNDRADDYAPSWSRDGKWVYFISLRTGRYEVWKVPAGGGDAVQVTTNRGGIAFESPDGKFVYYLKGEPSGSLWKMPTSGGEESQVLTSVNWRAFFPVNDGVYFIPEPGADRKYSIQFLSIATGKVKTVAPISRPAQEGLSVSPDGRFLLFSQNDEVGSDLMLVENFRW
jgi:Tol biopolymer transport system component/DNA-binding winged helix-turn-helix (wHTH) protein